MNRRLTALLAATALGGSLLFSACSAPAAPTDPAASTAPSAGPTSAPAPSTETSSPAAEPSSDDSAKPSKEDIVAGLTKFYESQQGLPSAKAKKFATCMVDEMYDKAKVKTLVAMKNGTPASADFSDAGLIAEAGGKCAPTIA